MADRYWVGGSGPWDTTSTANWSATSGGAAGASAPTAADTVYFNASSGTGTVTLGENVSCLLLLMSGYTGSMAFAGFKISIAGNATTVFTGSTTIGTITGEPTLEFTYAGSTGTRQLTTGAPVEAKSFSFKFIGGTDTLAGMGTVRSLDFTGFAGTLVGQARTIYGTLTLSSGMTLPSGVALTFAATSGTYTHTFAGKTYDGNVTINGAGSTQKFGDNFAIGATRTLTLTNGTLDGNGKNASIGTFALGAGTKTLTLGNGTWTVVGSGTAWDANTNVTGLTVSASTGTINMNSASAKTFAGGAKAWPTLNQGGAGALTIQQSNTFANITNTVQPATITLTAGTTQTVSAFGVSGTSGNIITLNSSSAGSQATLSDSSGTNSVSFVSIKDINATGGAAWEAFITNGNVDAGNNTGWDFLVQLGRYMYNVRKSKRILQQGVI